VLVSEIEIITDGGRRLRWSAADKLRIMEEFLYDGESISAVALDKAHSFSKLITPEITLLPGLGAEDDAHLCNAVPEN